MQDDVRDAAGNMPQDDGFSEIGFWCAKGSMMQQLKNHYGNSRDKKAATFDRSKSTVIISDIVRRNTF